MVLQDLGRRINAAVSDLTRSNSLDEKVISLFPPLRSHELDHQADDYPAAGFR